MSTDADVTGTLAKMFDQLGGLEGLVRGKTVAIKLNLTGNATDRLGYLPAEITHWVHPQVIGATVQLLGQAGAQRIRLLESPMSTTEPLEEFMLQANWEPRDFEARRPRGIREHELPGLWQEVFALYGLRRRLDVQVVTTSTIPTKTATCSFRWPS